MKNPAVLVASLLLLLLGSPLLGQEGIALPALPDIDAASSGVTHCLMNEAVQATPVAFENFTLSIDTGLTAKECREQSTCCMCTHFDGTRCRDWQPC